MSTAFPLLPAQSPENANVAQPTDGNALGHDFKAATCTEPSVCSRCGEESGSAAGHKWSEASCTSPKTCTVCGITSGEKTDHIISDGDSRCVVCGEFGYNANCAIKSCLNVDNAVNAEFFDSYRLLNVYYVEGEKCLCDPVRSSENYMTVFIYFCCEKDGESDYVLDVFDVHAEGEEHYLPCFSDIDCLYTYTPDDEIVKIRTKDYSLYYDENDLKKADFGKILK